MGLSFAIAAGPRQRILRTESRGTLDHIVLSQIRDSANLESQGAIFIFSRNRMAQLYPQALGFLFVASYDSQGYCGGIRPRLHTGLEFGVVTAAMKGINFCYVTPCSPMKISRRFGGKFRLYRQGWRISRARNQSESIWEEKTLDVI
jgi:hypothetical protein